MDWRKFLLGIFITLSMVFAGELSAGADADSCNPATIFSGTCTGAQTSSNSVNVWGRSITPGRVVDVSRPSSGRTSVSPVRSTMQTPYYPTGEIAFNCIIRLATRAACVPTPVVPAPVPAPVYYAPITLEDLASFTPQVVSLSSQPAGWTVLGVHTNFIATAQQHVVSGTLFGGSAEVRFTPSGFDWNYGDGSTRTSETGGASWEALGIAEFAATDTSHVYLSVGQFTTSVFARYRAEYRLGSNPWTSVDGEVSSSASTSVVLVQTADTVLAARDCTQQRGQQSCPL